MPRKAKGSGGAREGKPGQTYTNRTDMQAPKAKTGQTYGVAGQQLAAQRAQPLPAAPPTPTPGAVAPPPVSGGGSPLDVLAAMPGLTDPTLRPDEPLTAGLPIGPGPSPQGPVADPAEGLLRRMLAEGHQSPVLFDLLAQAEQSAPRNALMP